MKIKSNQFFLILFEIIASLFCVFYMFVKDYELVVTNAIFMLPIIFVIFTLIISFRMKYFFNYPIIFIVNVIFFIKLVIFPILFANAGFKGFLPVLDNELIVGVFFQIMECVIVTICLVIFYGKNRNKEITDRTIITFNKNMKMVLIGILIIYFLIAITHLDYLDYFVILDFGKSESEIGQHSGVLFSCFSLISRIMYQVLPLYILYKIHNSKIHGKFIYFIVLICSPLCITTDNHYISFVIIIVLVMMIFKYYPKQRPFLVFIGLIIISIIPSLTESKGTSNLSDFVAAYFACFSNMSIHMRIQGTNLLPYLFSDIIKSIPVLTAFIPSGDILSHLYCFKLFHSTRIDQFIPTINQFVLYFSVFSPLMYFCIIKMIKNIEGLYLKTDSLFFKSVCLEYVIILTYSLLTGNLNSLITQFCIFLVFLLFYKKECKR